MTARSRKSEALALLGLAQRAGAVVKGTAGARDALQRGEAQLVVVAVDGSGIQREKVLPLAEARGVPWVEMGSKVELGMALGTGPVASLAVTGPGIAGQIRKRLRGERTDG